MKARKLNKQTRRCDWEDCDKIVTRYGNQEHIFCSMECRKKYQSINLKGKNNPNYNRKWTNQQRSQQSKRLIERFEDDPILRERMGSANRGKKFSEKRRENISNGKRGIPGHKQTLESKALIGKHSKIRRQSIEYNEKLRKTNEERGHWIKECEREDKDVYFKQSDWICKMWDIVPDALKLVESIGIFNSFTNSKGAVRDHRVSRRYGFRNGVFPEILRHPCNCAIITHEDNLRKRFRGKGLDCSLTLNGLFANIRNYDGEWDEQEVVLLKIKEYELGERWKRN